MSEVLFFCPRCGKEHNDQCWVPFRSDEFWRGAAVLGGLLGMALAIRARNPCAFGDHDVYVGYHGNLECARCDWESTEQ